MIENIKQFVNEHRTLIAVIITVLVICFLYRWFCCKDRPLVDKVKGGGSLIFNVVCSNKGILIETRNQMVGFKINPSIGVLSIEGIELLKRNDEESESPLIKYDNYINVLFNKYRVIDALVDPLEVLGITKLIYLCFK